MAYSRKAIQAMNNNFWDSGVPSKRQKIFALYMNWESRFVAQKEHIKKKSRQRMNLPRNLPRKKSPLRKELIPAEIVSRKERWMPPGCKDPKYNGTIMGMPRGFYKTVVEGRISKTSRTTTG
jgi:hypothetical protein